MTRQDYPSAGKLAPTSGIKWWRGLLG